MRPSNDIVFHINIFENGEYAYDMFRFRNFADCGGTFDESFISESFIWLTLSESSKRNLAPGTGKSTCKFEVLKSFHI